MFACMLQWYLKVPGVIALKEKDAPEARSPLLKLVPSSDVTVCASGSLLVQVTVVPAFMLTLAGKAIPDTFIAVPTPVGDGEVVVFDLEQENVIQTAIRITAINFERFVVFIF